MSKAAVFWSYDMTETRFVSRPDDRASTYSKLSRSLAIILKAISI